MYPIVDNVCVRLTEFIKNGPVNENGFEAKEVDDNSVISQFTENPISAERQIYNRSGFELYLWHRLKKFGDRTILYVYHGIDCTRLVRVHDDLPNSDNVFPYN